MRSESKKENTLLHVSDPILFRLTASTFTFHKRQVRDIDMPARQVNFYVIVG